MSVTLNNLRFSGSTSFQDYVPPPPTIPAGSIIMYNGSDPNLSAWTRYSAADNLYLLGTATQNQIGTSTTPATSLNHSYSLSTTGGHTSTTGYSFMSSANAGAISAIPSNPAGDHTHSLTMTSSNAAARPYTTNVTLLRNSSPQTVFPANTIHINSTNRNSWTQKVAATTKRYIRGGATGVVDVAPVTIAVSGTTSTSGQHDHVLGGQRSSSSTGSGVYNTASLVGQDHSHSVTGDVTIDGLNGKLMKLWIASNVDITYSNTIVMFDGNLSDLPTTWKVCNGTNNTANLVDYFLGYSSTSSDHELATSNSISISSSGAYDAWTHQHATAATSGASTIVLTTGHQSQGFSHTHTVTVGSGTTSHDPGTYRVAFIQYVG